jgi:ribonuclease HI
MAAKKQKYYVVWKGHVPGIYLNWDECKAQIHGVEQAQYKSYESKLEAEVAMKKGAGASIFAKKVGDSSPKAGKISRSQIIPNALCVDAACSGNPGDMEYRGVWNHTKEQVFHIGPLKEGTNNIGEFLALVHALAFLKQHDLHTTPIYTDSKTAMSWIRNKKVKTTLAPTARNAKVFELLERANGWLDANTYKNPIYKWETEDWGEIPADFGRK